MARPGSLCVCLPGLPPCNRVRGYTVEHRLIPDRGSFLMAMSFHRFLLLPLLLLASSTLWADTGDSGEIAAIRALLNKTQPNIEVGEIVRSPVEGLYEVGIQNGQTIYVSHDAKYLIPGDLYQAQSEGLINLGENRRNELRREKIAALDE